MALFTHTHTQSLSLSSSPGNLSLVTTAEDIRRKSYAVSIDMQEGLPLRSSLASKPSVIWVKCSNGLDLLP